MAKPPVHAAAEAARLAPLEHIPADVTLNGFRQLFARMDEGFSIAEVVRGAGGRVVDIRFVELNPTFERHTGRSRASMLGKLRSETLGHDERMLAYVQGVADTGTPVRFEMHVAALGRWYDASIYRWGPDLIANVFDDITERKHAEAALRTAKAELEIADRQKNLFLAVLSHELRNPLAPIRSSLDVLDRVPCDSTPGRHAKAVLDRQVDQLARLVDDLLDLTRILQGKVQLRRATLDLNELVRETLADYEDQCTAAGLTLAFEPAYAPVPIEGDRQRLAQAVSNLLHNAVKFTPAGGRVTVRVTAASASATVVVADTGAGIATPLLGHLFEPFTQADETLDRSQGGLGLGLALVKGLVEQHGGAVAAASPGLGRGATFTLRLPLASAPETASTPVPTPPAGPALRVLVVDDNADAAESLRVALELHGYAVVTARDGAAALATAQACRPHVVICDIGLPAMDGYAVARALRADATLRTTFLVALSGYALPDDVERARAAGFDRHLAKPQRLGAILQVLREGAHQSPSNFQ